ncbi:KRAB domain-containing zinc finger protein [Sarotherodon galilaeus]
MSSTRVHRPIRIYMHGLTERKNTTSNVPFASYKYDSANNDLPGELFHIVRKGDLYAPTLHGLTAEYIRTSKDVAVCSANSSMASRPFVNTPHMYEIELINTGHEPLQQGDRFTIQLPNKREVTAQLEAPLDPGYDLRVNKGIWGGLLATRRVNTKTGGDCIEELLRAIKDEEAFDVFELMSPYTPNSTLSMLTLVANGGGYHNVPDAFRPNTADAANGEVNQMNIEAVINDNHVKRYLRTVIRHALTIEESVQGFACGQVIRACKGYTTSPIHTSERFCAQLNTNRWLT